MIRFRKIETPLGTMTAAATDEGICLLEFSDRNTLPAEYHELEKLLNQKFEEGDNQNISMLEEQLKEYFNGLRKEFDINMITPGTDFQKSVWRELCNIPYGSTRSYTEQSEALGKPLAIRAIANANGMNRIAIVIPCHRVIGANGSLVGYGGGLRRKQWLLDHEKKYSGQAVDLSLF